MTLIQRVGSAANLNIHLHCLVGLGRFVAYSLEMSGAEPPSQARA